MKSRFLATLLPAVVLAAAAGSLGAQPPRIFVVDAAGETLEVIDASSNAVIGSIAVGTQPGDPVLSPDRSRIYVPNRGSNDVSIIDVATETLIGTITGPSLSEPVSVAPTPNGRELWVLNRTGGGPGQGSISIVDTATLAVTAVLNDPSFRLPRHLAFNRSGTRAYVSNTGNGTVTVFLPVTRQVLLTVNVGDGPDFASVRLDGREVYVSRPGLSSLARIRTQDHTVFDLLLTGAPGRSVVRGDELYVALGNNLLAVINTLNSVTTFIPFAGGSTDTFGPALISGASRGYVTDSGGNRIRAFDTFNRVEITGGGFPITAVAQPRGIVTTGVLTSVDLRLQKTAGTASVGNGQEVDFTLRAGNAGPSAANQVVVTDTLPAGLEFVSASTDQGSCQRGGATVECSLGSLAPGEEVTIRIRVRTSLEGTLTNTAQIAALEADANPADNTGSASVQVTPAADLAVLIRDDPDPVVIGQQLDYRVRVENRAASLANAVVLTATLPPGVEFVSAGGGGANCQVSAGGVLCNLSAIRGGDAFELTISVLPAAAGTILFSATVRSTTFDPNPDNNTSTVRTLVVPTINQSDLQLAKTVSPAAAGRAEQVVYTLTLTNQGPQSTPAARFLEDLPANLVFEGFNNAFGVCEMEEPDELLCQLGQMAAGTSRSVTLFFRVGAQARGLIVNRARALTAGIDPDTSNDEATADLLVLGTADFNRDGVVDAGDLQLLVLELTDGDGEDIADVGGGSFIGSPGMDLNLDGRVTLVDAAVLVRLIFAQP